MAATIAELVALLPPEQRATEDVTRTRLERCRACPHLTSGLCALCGCYVELRSAKARMACPDIPARW